MISENVTRTNERRGIGRCLKLRRQRPAADSLATTNWDAVAGASGRRSAEAVSVEPLEPW